MQFNEWLTAKGIDPEGLSAEVKTVLQATWRAEQNPAPTPTPQPAPAPQPAAGGPAVDWEKELAVVQAENERQDKIRDLAMAAIRNSAGNTEKTKQLKELAQAAIASKTDVRTFELQLVRADRTNNLIISSVQQVPVTGELLEAAVCRAGGLKTLEKSYSAQVLEASDKAFKGGCGLHQLIAECAQHNGYRIDASRVKGSLSNSLRAAFQGGGDGFGMAATVGVSTLSISGILSNVANKYVKESFLFVEDVWRRISAIRSVPDFKTITGYSLTGDLTYERIAPGGEIKEGTLGNETYTNKADSYGKLLGIDRTQLINDDMGALAQAARRLGRGGALKINDVFWAKFLNNASFFTSGRANYDDGASDTLMDATGLANANGLFMALNDPDGKPTGTTPRILLTPTALWPLAWRLVAPSPGGDTTATISPFAGMYDLVQSRYLSNSTFTGYSTKAWYLLADPNDLPVIEMVFLNGNQEPTVETADLEFNRLGIALRGYHDFGCELQEYRGGVKMKGEA